MGAKKKPAQDNTIASNRRARHDYFLEAHFEAGLVLNGWEVKALREGKGQLADSFVTFKNSEAWLQGALITPLNTVCTHYVTEPNRMRKLLLNRRELNRLIEGVEQRGYTVVVTRLYWKRHLVKCDVALAKGKQLHDKRDTEKERDWQEQKQRALRSHNRTA
jgi:SsrA-binding protein